MACPPAKSTTWSRLSARRQGSPRAKSAASAASSTSRLQAFRDRPLDSCRVPVCVLGRHLRQSPQCWPDRGSRAVIVATGRHSQRRPVKSSASRSATPKTAQFWIAFLRGAAAPVASPAPSLVISDAHLGLREAISSVMLGATWQRCKVHLARNVLAKVPEGLGGHGRRRDAHHLRATPTPATSSNSSTRSSPCSPASSPTPPPCSPRPATDVLAFCRLPRSALAEDLVHQPARTRQRARSNAAPDVVGIFPNDTAVLRLVQRRRRRNPRRMARHPPLPRRCLHGRTTYRHRRQTRRCSTGQTTPNHLAFNKTR